MKRSVLAVTAILVVSAATCVRAQESFRITWTVDRTAERARVEGRIFNDARLDVHDVSVTAEALDSRGRVVARGIAFVSPVIRQGGSAPFVATVPAVAGATTYRVRVTSFRLGFGSESP
ncbi:MAG TPA: FxLYD domain-containing protein [Candidatus Binatia bacterium]|nr:FxLYD domain-containing protein [Candidatus Binatia bacterium]